MSIKYHKFIPGAFFVLWILIGIIYINPICYAGGAVVLMPAEDSDVPQGSFIPDRRTKAVEKKVKEHKAKMKARSSQQPSEQVPQNESPKPKPQKK